MAEEPVNIHVAIVTDGIFPYSIGGIQRHSRKLVETLSNYPGLRISVLHPHEEKIFNDLSNVEEYSIEDIDLSKNYLKECYAYSKRCHNKVSELQADIVYAQGLTIWYKLNDFKGKLINNPHGIESFQATGFKDRIIGSLFRSVQRKIFRGSEYVISEGGHLTSLLEKATGKKEKVLFIPNAADIPGPYPTSRKFPDKEQKIKCLFLARFASNKGIDILLESIVQLPGNIQEQFSFTLAGKGPLYAPLKEKYGHLPNVEFLGFVEDSDLPQIFLDHHVFVFPTLFEGMPTAIIEAMSYGLPVIGTDTGALPELIKPENGYLIPKGNIPALKDALMAFFSLSSDEKHRLSRSSYDRMVENFSWPKVGETHHQLFRKMQE